MKQHRRILSLALSLAITMYLLPTSALSATAEEGARCKYDMIFEFSDGMAQVVVQVGTEQEEYDGEVYEYPVYQYGFIDQTGAEVIAPQYSRAENFSDGLALVYEGNRAHFIDKTGAQVSIKMEYTCYPLGTGFHDGLFAVFRERDDLEEPGYYCGYVDKAGKEVIPCIYDDIEDFSEGLARVGIGEGSACRFGFIDTAGKEVVALKYDSASFQFSDGFAKVKLDGKYGVIDKTGKEVVPCKYDVIGDISGNLAKVGMDSGETDEWGNIIYKWSIVNTDTGKEVVPCIYDDIADFSEGLSPVQKDGKWGFVDEAGKVVIPCKYDSVGSFSEGLAPVANLYYEDRYSEEHNPDEEMYLFWGFIDKTGKEVIPLEYAEVGGFSDGLAYAHFPRSAEWEFIDKTGKRVMSVLDGVYEYGRPVDFFRAALSKGLVAVSESGGWGFVDQATKEQTSVHCYAEMKSLSKNYAAVAVNWDDPHWGIIDLTGKLVVPCQYSSIYRLTENLVEVKNDGKYGVVNIHTGKEVVPCAYDRIESFSDSLVKVGMDSGKKDEWGNPIYKWGIVAAKQSIEAPAPIIADPTNDALTVDGVSQVPAAYKIGGANYFLLRDVAMLLNGTKGQFSVDYDAQKQAVVIVTGQPYKPLGTELAGAAQSSTEAIVGNNDVYINGEKVDLAVYKIGGANYFKIRDLGKALGFNVGWTAEQGMFIESDKPYVSPNN